MWYSRHSRLSQVRLTVQELFREEEEHFHESEKGIADPLAGLPALVDQDGGRGGDCLYASFFIPLNRTSRRSKSPLTAFPGGSEYTMCCLPGMSSLSARCNFCEERVRLTNSQFCELCQDSHIRYVHLLRLLPGLTANLSFRHTLVLSAQAACLAVRTGELCAGCFDCRMHELFPCKSPVYRKNTSIRHSGEYFEARCNECWPCKRANTAWYLAGCPGQWCHRLRDGSPCDCQACGGSRVVADGGCYSCWGIRDIPCNTIDATLLSYLRLFGVPDRLLSQQQRDAARDSASAAEELWETLPESVQDTLSVFWRESSCPRCGIPCPDIPVVVESHELGPIDGGTPRAVQWERRAILAGCCIACCCRWPRSLEDGRDTSSVSSPGLTAVWGGLLRRQKLKLA